MNKQTVVALSVLIFAILLFVLLGKDDAAEAPAKTVEVEKVEEPPAQTKPVDLAVVPTKPPEEWGVNAEMQEFLKKSMADPKYEWKQPIEFYGKVVTLDGQPLEGVTVEYGWTSLNGYDKRTVRSDADGLFDLTDARGKSMTVKLEKEGYDWFKTRTQKHFEFAEPNDPEFHKGNPDTPLVYYMQERPDAEPLHAWRTRRGILVADKGSVYYNYLTGTFSKGSNEDAIKMDLQIDLTNEEDKKPFNWTITLSSQSHSFYQTEDFVHSVAPIDGYSDHVEIGKRAADEDWFNDRTYRIFFKDKTGNYGYLYLSPRLNREEQKASVRLDSYFNPNGSPVLVFDSRKRIR